MALQPINYAFLQDPKEPQISGCLQRIIEKKINNISLSCFETIAHYFLITFSCLYPAYSRLYNYNIERMPPAIPNHPIPDPPIVREPPAGLKFEDNGGILSGFPDKDERIQQFMRYTNSYDGTALLDLTVGKIASITNKNGRDYPTIAHPALGEVSLNDRPVVFKPTMHDIRNHRDFFGFGKTRGTSYVTVEDFDGHPGQVRITESRTEGQPNHWIVDTNKKYQQLRFLIIECQPSRMVQDPVYVTEEAILGIQNPSYLKQEEL